MTAFVGYPKIPRICGALMTITEKIDGTNAQVVIEDGVITLVGSRKRAITPEVDNFGFAAWVAENANGLLEFLGNGQHFGEWAGIGIQKNPLGLEKKQWFLFNTHRNPPQKFAAIGHLVEDLESVPVLYEGPFDLDRVEDVLRRVLVVSKVRGAIYGRSGEGIVVSAFGQKFKKTGTNVPKGAAMVTP